MKGDSEVVAWLFVGLACFVLGVYSEGGDGFGIAWNVAGISAAGSMLAGVGTVVAASIALYAAIKWQQQIHYKEKYTALKDYKKSYFEWCNVLSELCFHVELRYNHKMKKTHKPYYLDSEFDRLKLDRLVDEYFAAWMGINSALNMLEASGHPVNNNNGAMVLAHDRLEEGVSILQRIAMCEGVSSELPCRAYVLKYKTTFLGSNDLLAWSHAVLESTKIRFDQLVTV